MSTMDTHHETPTMAEAGALRATLDTFQNSEGEGRGNHHQAVNDEFRCAWGSRLDCDLLARVRSD